MPSLAAISKIDFPFKVDQQEVKQRARELFSPSFPQVERMLSAFDNTEIKTRNFCKPLQLCSLTFLRDDYSKSNFIGSSLFADGVAAIIISGDNHTNKTKNEFRFLATQSKLYYDTPDVMGWEFTDTGFKVLFSHDIPTIIAENIYDDVTSFLDKHHLK